MSAAAYFRVPLAGVAHGARLGRWYRLLDRRGLLGLLLVFGGLGLGRLLHLDGALAPGYVVVGGGPGPVVVPVARGADDALAGAVVDVRDGHRLRVDPQDLVPGAAVENEVPAGEVGLRPDLDAFGLGVLDDLLPVLDLFGQFLVPDRQLGVVGVAGVALGGLAALPLLDGTEVGPQLVETAKCAAGVLLEPLVVGGGLRPAGPVVGTVALTDALAHRVVHPRVIAASAALGVVSDEDGLATGEPLGYLVARLPRGLGVPGGGVGVSAEPLRPAFGLLFPLPLRFGERAAVGVVDGQRDLEARVSETLGEEFERGGVGGVVTAVREVPAVKVPAPAERLALGAAVLAESQDFGRSVAPTRALDQGALLYGYSFVGAGWG